jgi:two-component system sensor histidine kinase UhpB
MRNYMKRLKTPAFAGDELYKALRDYIPAFEKETRLKVSLSLPSRPLQLSRGMGREVYQIIHEALNNVRKHAEANHVEIQLSQLDNAIHLTICDDGRGFPALTGKAPGSPEACPWSIQERARTLKGSLQVQSNSGQGARLTITIPLSS